MITMENYLFFAEELYNFPPENDLSPLLRIFDAGDLAASVHHNNSLKQIKLSLLNKSNYTYVLDDKNKKFLSEGREHFRIYDSSTDETTEESKIIGPSDAEFEDLFTVIRQQQFIFHSVVNHCSQTKIIPPRFFEFAFSTAQKNQVFKLNIVKNMPILSFDVAPTDHICLEDEMDIKIYLYPLFGGYIDRLFNVKNCDRCGRAFFYKLDKASYCSKKCRDATRRQRLKESSAL